VAKKNQKNDRHHFPHTYTHFIDKNVHIDDVQTKNLSIRNILTIAQLIFLSFHYFDRFKHAFALINKDIHRQNIKMPTRCYYIQRNKINMFKYEIEKTQMIEVERYRGKVM